MAPAAQPIPAVVVGGSDNCGGLGVVRSLGQAGIPVIAVDDDKAAPALHSRFARSFIAAKTSGPELIRDLLALRAELDVSPVLFLATDDSAMTVSRYRAELEGRYVFRMPPHDCVSLLANKNTFHQLAQQHGAPIPRSIRIQRIADFDRLAELTFPCIVKPSIKTAAYIEGGFERAYKVRSVAEAESVCAWILPVLPDLAVEEWIEGGDDEIYFCLVYRGANGNICSFTGRKLSIWPPDVGTTASCTVASEVHATLDRLTDDFFRAISFFGMGSMEFKRDVRTGRFLMIEPTVGRADWQEEVATIHGMNIPQIAYLYETGRPWPAAQDVRSPVIWRDYARHWMAVRHRPTPRTQNPPYKVYDTYWRLHDPMPALFHVRHAFAKRLQAALSLIQRPAPADVGASAGYWRPARAERHGQWPRRG